MNKTQEYYEKECLRHSTAAERLLNSIHPIPDEDVGSSCSNDGRGQEVRAFLCCLILLTTLVSCKASEVPTVDHTAPPWPSSTTTTSTVQPSGHHLGWVDLGNGIFGPEKLLAIAACESGVRDEAGGPVMGSHDYEAMADDGGPDAGAYQFIPPTWLMATGIEGSAIDASPAAQDAAAVQLIERWGEHHWVASEGCWSQWAGGAS